MNHYVVLQILVSIFKVVKKVIYHDKLELDYYDKTLFQIRSLLHEIIIFNFYLAVQLKYYKG